MSSARKLLLGVASIAIAAVAIWFLFLRGHHAATPAAPTATAAADDPWASASKPRAKDTPAPGAAPIFLRDADPVGTLRLEGQVLDEQDKPVAGAEVWLGAAPPRKATTEDDGSFGFDKLVGRVYRLEARQGDRVGGPIAYTLTAGSDPAVVRLRRGQTLVVIVTAAGDGKPIAGAQVETRGLMEQTASTDKDGRAQLHGIAPGWITVAVAAPGYAPAHSLSEVKEGQAEVRVQLQKGAAVAGVVTDEAGAPIAKARVMARDVAGLFADGDASKDGVVADDHGHFTLPSVAAGSYRFIATDDDHAPGSSEPITVDGVSRRDGVTILMKKAAVLVGKVVTKDKQPAPYATVKVTPKDLGAVDGVEAMQASEREVVADADGGFTLHGLPRAELRARAESDAAASAIAEIDLRAGDPPPLLLVLDVSGTIAGVVVDGDGQPVAEAQVTTVTDVLAGGKVEDIALTGFSQSTTDGGGKFAVHGLPPGAYRLWASRGGGGTRPFNQKGVAARTGDTAVKIVLPAPGGIKGKLVLEDGSLVKAGTVQSGFLASAAVVSGGFELRDLPPGSYDLRIHGPDFAQITRPDVEVAAGKTTDVGTIKVRRGRKVTGHVAMADGTPIGGAKVSVGNFLISSGNQGGAGSDGALDDQLGTRTTTTSDDGDFALLGVGPEGGTIIADHPTRGRSAAMTVPPGTEDPPPITLALHGFGSLGGKITSAGKPLGSAAVTVSERDGGSHTIIVTTGADGTYLIEKVPEGPHHVAVMRASGIGGSMFGGDTVVTLGTRTTFDLDLPVGAIKLTVVVKPLAGAKVDAAIIYVFSGSVAAKTNGEMRPLLLQGGTTSGDYKVWFGGAAPPAVFQISEGAHTICTVPITGDLSDTKLQARLFGGGPDGDRLDAYCVPDLVKPDPIEQSYTHEVPAMKPLPPPT